MKNIEEERIVRTLETKAGGIVHLIKPLTGPPFFRYKAPPHAAKDSFRYIIEQFGLTSSAVVNILVKTSVEENDVLNMLNAELDKIFTCMTFFVSKSSGTIALRNILDIEDGKYEDEYLNEKWLGEIFYPLIKKEFSDVSSGLFDFKKHTGIYTYDPVKKVWGKATGTKLVEFHFPADPSSKIIDSSIIIENYQYSSTPILDPDDDEKYYFPSSFSAHWILYGKKIFETRLGQDVVVKDPSIKSYETQYHETGLPLNLFFEGFCDPYSIKFSITHLIDPKSGHLTFNAQFLLTEKAGCALQIDASLTLSRSKFKLEKDLTLKDIIAMNADLTVNGLTIKDLGKSLHTYVLQEGQPEPMPIEKIFTNPVFLHGKKIGFILLDIKNETINIQLDESQAQVDISSRIVNYLEEYFKRKVEIKEELSPEKTSALATSKTSLMDASASKVELVTDGLKNRFATTPEGTEGTPLEKRKLLKRIFPGGNQSKVK